MEERGLVAGFKVEMMEEFLKRGLKDTGERRGIDVEGWAGGREMGLARVVAVAMSRWLYMAGFSEETLELA
jgi:hypothetical protein